MDKKRIHKKGLSFGKIAKLGIDSVKTKPIRFTITVILFFVCLSAIGWGFSVVYADIPTAALRAYQTFDTDEVCFARSLNHDSRLENKDANVNFADDDVEQMEKAFSSNTFDKIYDFNIQNFGFNSVDTIKYYDNNALTGCAVADEAFLSRYGYKLLYGKLPQNQTEIAIPKYFFELCQYYGYRENSENRKIPIDDYKDISKIKIKIRNILNHNVNASIVGVVDTGFSSEEYEILKSRKANVSEKDWDDYTNASQRFTTFLNSGFQNVAFVHSDFIKSFVNGYEADALIMDQTGMAIYAEKAFAIPYSDAIGKNIVRPSEKKEELDADECFAPLNYFKYKMFYSEEQLLKKIREGLTLDIRLGSNPTKKFKVVGYFDDTIDGGFIFADSVYAANAEKNKTHRTISCLMTKLSNDRALNKRLIAQGLSEFDADYNYSLGGLAGDAVMQMHSIKTALLKYLPVFGTVIILFSALMMFNFISATISAKKKDIGILRAIGARNNAVYGIFASESIFTVIVAFLASVVGSWSLTYYFNCSMNFQGVYIKFLTYGFVEAITVLLIGSAIALLGSLIPILKLIRKKPMEILR